MRDVAGPCEVIDEDEEEGLILVLDDGMVLPRTPPNSSTSLLALALVLGCGRRLFDRLRDVLLEKTVFIRPMIAELPELDRLPKVGLGPKRGEVCTDCDPEDGVARRVADPLGRSPADGAGASEYERILPSLGIREVTGGGGLRSATPPSGMVLRVFEAGERLVPCGLIVPSIQGRIPGPQVAPEGGLKSISSASDVGLDIHGAFGWKNPGETGPATGGSVKDDEEEDAALDCCRRFALGIGCA
jgi:hypothetical protein